MDFHPVLETVFAVVLIGFLVVDLGFLSRRPHKVEMKEAVLQTLFWVSISLGFAGLICWTLGTSQALDFTSAYITEKMLSVDNLFVILLLFKFFKVDGKYHHRVLTWGIMGAVVLRALFIGLGAAVVGHFHWVLYLFGALLVYTGFKLWFGKEDEEPDFEENKILKWAKRHLPLTYSDHGGKLFLVEHGKKVCTLLFLVLIMVETTDIVFAMDSIPAVLSITHDPFIAFTSNIFAVMGLRALYFLVENIMSKLRFLQKGLAFVLTFIGLKMIADIFGIEINSMVSFGVIVASLGISGIVSVLIPEK